MKQTNGMSLMETMLKRNQMQSTRNHSQQASKSQAKVLNLMPPQEADVIYENLLALVQ